jgi:PAS domain S-box-containing protein
VSENAATAGSPTSEAVEELLRQLVDARFVLTDREGTVTRWSRPAEELFGWPGARMLGRPLVETLELGIGLPETGGRLNAIARRKDGQELEVALTFVPVRMSQSLEFNGFLEALEIVAPRGNALGQLQRSHKTVVDWISAAVAGQAEIEEEGLAAGTIVAFRPLQQPPPPAPDPGDEPVAAPPRRSDDVERLLEDTNAELTAARAETEELRGEAGRASARLQQLEEAGAVLGSELADTRRVLEEMAAQVEGLRGELERTRAALAERLGDRDGLERALTSAAERVEALERAREEERARTEERRSVAADLAETKERLEAQQRSLVDGRADDNRRLRSELDELHGRVAELGDDAGRALQLRTELEETRRLVESLGARIEEVQVEAVSDEEARLLFGDLREELTGLRSGALESAVDAAEQHASRSAASAIAAGEHARAAAGHAGRAEEQAAAAAAEAAELARRAVEEAGAEAQAARRAVEEAAGGRGNEAANGDSHTRAGAEDTDPCRPLFGRKPGVGPAREPRPGFDEVTEPRATIEMDGHFRELNQAFTDLVGYSEEDFRSASWPPVMDRANLPKHREQLKKLIAGEIASAEVNTGYVHAQGLLVPVIGTISLVTVDGQPDHFLLAAKS